MLLPHFTGYQGINRVLKALGGRRKWRVFREGARRDSELWRDKEGEKRGRVKEHRETDVLYI